MVALVTACLLPACFAGAVVIDEDVDVAPVEVPAAPPQPPPAAERPPGGSRTYEVPVLAGGGTEPLVVEVDGRTVCLQWIDAGSCGGADFPEGETFLLGAGGHGDAQRTCGAWWGSPDLVEIALTAPDGTRWVQPALSGSVELAGARVFALCWAYGQPIGDAVVEGRDASGDVVVTFP